MQLYTTNISHAEIYNKYTKNNIMWNGLQHVWLIFTLEIEGQVESIVLWQTVSHAVFLHIWSNIECIRVFGHFVSRLFFIVAFNFIALSELFPDCPKSVSKLFDNVSDWLFHSLFFLTFFVDC